MGKTKDKTIFSIEDKGAWFVSGFADGFIKGATLPELRQHQETLIKAVIQLEEAIRRKRPADERKALSVDISHTLKVETDEREEYSGGYTPALSAALLMAVDMCEIDGEPDGEWEDEDSDDL